jgi:hypothetical protein
MPRVPGYSATFSILRGLQITHFDVFLCCHISCPAVLG